MPGYSRTARALQEKASDWTRAGVDMAEVIMPEDEEVNPVGDDVEEEDEAGRYTLRNRAT